MIIGCSTEPEDCAGVTNGDSQLDICGTCDDEPSNDCQDCSTYFTWNQSTSQASYFFKNVTINGENISSEDSVAAFKGDICAGSIKWDTSQCNGAICEIVAQGEDGFDNTRGYFLLGDIPTFKIYDVSDSVIYNATTTDTIKSFSPNGFYTNIDTLVANTTSAYPCQR